MSATLQVIKNGVIVDSVAITKGCMLLGRLPSNDVVMEHASISRHHAMIAFHGRKQCFMLVDLTSAHGSWVVGGPKLIPGEPVELHDGSELRFGASTREYSFKCPKVPSPRKRRRVSFAADLELAQIIGYSDGRDFALVGPMPVKPNDTGRFANLVTSSQRMVVKSEGMASTAGIDMRSSESAHTSDNGGRTAVDSQHSAVPNLCAPTDVDCIQSPASTRSTEPAQQASALQNAQRRATCMAVQTTSQAVRNGLREDVAVAAIAAANKVLHTHHQPHAERAVDATVRAPCAHTPSEGSNKDDDALLADFLAEVDA